MVSISKISGQTLGRNYELAEKLVNERIQDAEWWELLVLLTHSDEGHQAYIETMLLHSDLQNTDKDKRPEHSYEEIQRPTNRRGDRHLQPQFVASVRSNGH